MESNREDARRCLTVARAALDAGDFAKAARFAAKSSKMYPSPQADALADQVRAVARASQPQPPEFTEAQRAAVAEILSVPAHDLYKTLGVQRAATQDDIKRAYRKRALRLHPDKNTAPGAEDAFKRLSHAMQVLSDTTKRRNYDSFGDDDGATSSRANSQAAFRRRRNTNSDPHEVSPDEFFNMFFGGRSGAPFGNSAHVWTYSSTGPSFRQNRRQTSQQIPPSWGSFVPAFLMLFGLISYLSSEHAQPSLYALDPDVEFKDARLTGNANLPYFVSTKKTPDGVLLFDTKYPQSSPQLSRIEQRLERAIFMRLEDACRQERIVRIRYQDMANSWLRARSEREKFAAKAQSYRMPNCELFEKARKRAAQAR